MSLVDVKGEIVSGVTAPTLKELQTRKCSLEELQSALVQLITIVNRNAEHNANRRTKNVRDLEFNM